MDQQAEHAQTEPKPLDLTIDRLESDKSGVPSGVEDKREDTRKQLAIGLLAILVAACIAWVGVAFIPGAGSAVAVAALDKIFAGMLALTGTVVGFYFGAAAGPAKP